MKKIKYSLLVSTIITMLFSSCESFTEIEPPQSQLLGEAVFESYATAEAALADIYARLREGGFASGNQNSATLLIGSYSDDFTFYGNNENIQQFSNHTLLPANTQLTGLWNLAYGQIYAANAILEGVQQSQAVTRDGRNQLMGEALFIRAYIHFYLVALFGDVPYVITTDYNHNAKISKTPQVQVWQNIIIDLQQAENLLSESYPTDSRTRANKAVVQAMLSRVYLYTKDWQQSENYATRVIENPLFVWETNPEKVFLKDSPGIIWSLHPGMQRLNTNDARTFYFSAGPPSKSVISENLFDAFESGDLRKSLWIKSITNGTGTWFMPYKYKKQSATASSEEYTILLRLAEQYLVRAEARVHNDNISGAQEDVNKIRNRAGLSNTTADTQELLLDAILKERRFELFSEQGHRWLDLKRTGNASAVLSLVKPNWQLRDILLPIPEKELILNNNLLPQNPGY